MKQHRRLFSKLLFLTVLTICLMMLLASCGECDHQWGDWTVSEKPSCETAGKETRACSACGETQSQNVAASGHHFDTYVSCEDATCQSDGTETATCADCGKTDTRTVENSKNPTKHTGNTLRYESIDETSHKAIYTCCGVVVVTESHRWDNGVTDPDNAQNILHTCQDCGKTKSVDSAHVHSAQRISATASDCTTQGNIEHWYCEGCNTRFTTAELTQTISEADTKLPISHSSQEFDYVPLATDPDKHEKKHACCGTLVAIEDHRWDDGVTDPGNAQHILYTCQDCGKTKSVDPAHVHSAQRISATASNCTTQGNIEHWYCEGCNTRFTTAELTQTISEADTKLPISHSSQEFDYVPLATDPDKHEKKHACCGTLVAIEAHDHEAVGSTPATCEQNGSTTYRCVCGNSYTADSSIANGHNVIIWNLETETLKSGTSCTYNQVYTGFCLTCTQPATKSVEITRHSYVATVTEYPTCKAEGSKTYVCACGATPDEPTVTIEINPDAHRWNDGVTDGSVTTYTCLNGCGHTKTAVVFADPTQTVDKSLLESNEVVLGGISLKLDQTTLDLLADDPAQEVTVVANPVDVSTLPEAIRNQLPQNAPIYDFALSQGGVPITQFGDGRITITLPYSLPADADADCVSVWYIDDEGELSYYAATYYETEDGGFVIFDAAHFSTYLPGLAPSADACELYGHNYDTKTTAPTCDQKGYTEYHCQRCGESKLDDITDALGHAYDSGTGTEPTCMAGSTMIFSCTRSGCDHSQEITLAPNPHSWQYVSQESTSPTCTEDGISVYRCTNDGCTAKKTEVVASFGGHELYDASAKLADGATSCEDGVVITKKCYHDGCQYTETKTITDSHVRIDKFGFDEYGNSIIPETKIMLGSYLDALGISYREEPYITLVHGCFCGAHKEYIEVFNGSSEYDGELLTGNWIYISAMSPCDGEYLLQTTPNFTWDPIQGMPVESPVFKIRFVAKTTRVGCLETFAVTIQIGYDETTGTATETLTYKLYEEIRHMNIKYTATVDDPSKSCFENCPVVNGQLVYGIHVTEYCADCQTITDTFDTAVSSSSSHYFYTTENYEYDCENGRESYYGVRVFIKECPCGQTEYLLYMGDCDFERTTDGNTTIHTCRDCGYIYAERTVEIEDVENCRYSYTKFLYLNCASANDVTNCEKTVTCCIYDEVRHYHTTNENNHDNPTPTDIPCRYAIYSKNVCDACGEITYLYEGYVMIHDLNTTTSTDSHKNVTTTESCCAEGCGYQSIVIADKNGNILRDYRIEKDYSNGELCISLSTWKMADGIRKETLERNEYYTLDGSVLLRWAQWTYTYSIEMDKGCICTVVFTNYKGDYDRYESFFCQYGEEIRQEKTCQQDGFCYFVCSACGHREYSYYEESNGHEYYDGACIYCSIPCSHEYDDYGWCHICYKNCEHLSYTEGVCNECHRVCEHPWWNDGVCDTCGMVCTHDYDEYGWCHICGKNCDHAFTEGVCDECGMACDHPWWNEGVCDTCGVVCIHDYDESGWCHICEMTCHHNYTEGVCDECGMACDHPWWNEGVCEICGVVCIHDYDEYGWCHICQIMCTHNYTDGICSECQRVCEHSWDGEGICSECQSVCEHKYINGQCNVCNKMCAHEYDNNWCSVCGMPCPHDGYDDGEVCGLCGAVTCFHSWVESVCEKCSIPCAHDYQYGCCNICYKTCIHESYTDSICDECGTQCYTHTWTDGVCDECGTACQHGNYDKGLCLECGEECEHDYENSLCHICHTLCKHEGCSAGELCNKCGTAACFHNWNEGVCQDCNVECYHIFDNGACITCGKPCEHNYVHFFEFSQCNICNKRCNHDAWGDDGICDECGETCDHEYKSGICSVCGKACEHNFENNWCMNCGAPCPHEGYANGEYCGDCGAAVCYHEWNEGMCIHCFTNCYHEFSNSLCVVCGMSCYHEFQEGICDLCGKVCEHNYQHDPNSGYSWCDICSQHCWHDGAWGNDSICDKCGYECFHEYHSWEGYCNICGMACGHNYENGYCYGCGKSCDHMGTWGDDHVCSECGMTCDHPWWNYGICAQCGKACEHSYEYGYCYECGKSCEHIGTWSDDHVCSECGMTCDHPWWNEGICAQCGKECWHENHDWEGNCSVCGKYCGHSYEYGTCYVCGKFCEHFDTWGGDNTCDECGYECFHEYHSWEGYCNICGMACGHNYENGYCYGCGKSCEHMGTWGDDNICDECGYECWHDSSYGSDICYTCGAVLQ